MVSWSPSQLVPDFVHQRSLALKHLKLQAGYSTAHRGDWGILTLSGRMRVDHCPHGENWEVCKHQFKMHDLCCHDKIWISFFGLFVFILSFHFRETFQKQPRHGLFPDGENQILGSNIFSHGKRKAQLKDFVELLESPARNFRGGLETEFDKKKSWELPATTWTSVSAKWIWDYIVLTVRLGYFGPKMKVSQILKD